VIAGHMLVGLCKVCWYVARGRYRRIIGALGRMFRAIAGAVAGFADQCRYDGNLTVNRVGYATVRKIYWIPLLCIFLLLVLSIAGTNGNGAQQCRPLEHPLPKTLVWIFWIWLLLGWPVAHLLVPFVISSLTCESCELELDAVGRWKCRSCGYMHHRERHILGPCPSCSKMASKVTCPQCSSTILLW
jgi:hypothetical protein